MKKSKLYTKTGDKGTTSLVGGTRIPKNHIRLDAYGTIDELNSYLGLLRSQQLPEYDKQNILKIQNYLFIVGGILATENEETANKLPYYITMSDIEWLEDLIDQADEGLPLLKSFVIPPANQVSAICHICRTICRRSERIIYTLSEKFFVPEPILIYMNRLSDYLFALSRQITLQSGEEDFFSNIANNNCK